MTKKEKYSNLSDRKKTSDQESIEELKAKIKHQKDALNKIIKNLQNEKSQNMKP